MVRPGNRDRRGGRTRGRSCRTRRIVNTARGRATTRGWRRSAQHRRGRPRNRTAVRQRHSWRTPRRNSSIVWCSSHRLPQPQRAAGSRLTGTASHGSSSQSNGGSSAIVGVVLRRMHHATQTGAVVETVTLAVEREEPSGHRVTGPDLAALTRAIGRRFVSHGRPSILRRGTPTVRGGRRWGVGGTRGRRRTRCSSPRGNRTAVR